MPSKKDNKLINSLKLKKFRQKYNLFVAEGPKIIASLLHSKNYRIRTIYHTSAYEQELSFSPEITHELVDERTMKSISFLKNPSSVLALLEIPSNNAITYGNRLIYLDGVQDPGNVGTIIRIADWFGFDAVIRSDDTADFYSPKVVQSTMGAFVNVQLGQLSRNDLLELKGYELYAADMGGASISSVNPAMRTILIMGSEGQGLHEVFNNHPEVQKISIPGIESRVSESLNVSVAAGIIVAHFHHKA